MTVVIGSRLLPRPRLNASAGGGERKAGARARTSAERHGAGPRSHARRLRWFEHRASASRWCPRPYELPRVVGATAGVARPARCVRGRTASRYSARTTTRDLYRAGCSRYRGSGRVLIPVVIAAQRIAACSRRRSIDGRHPSGATRRRARRTAQERSGTATVGGAVTCANVAGDHLEEHAARSGCSAADVPIREPQCVSGSVMA